MTYKGTLHFATVKKHHLYTFKFTNLCHVRRNHLEVQCQDYIQCLKHNTFILLPIMSNGVQNMKNEFIIFMRKSSGLIGLTLVYLIEYFTFVTNN